MSELTHTPGPWGIKRSKDGSGDIGITAPGVYNVVAECFAAMRHAAERSPEVDANARLIASAPDLLAALTALAAAARTACDARRYPELTEALSEADAALSKALSMGE